MANSGTMGKSDSTVVASGTVAADSVATGTVTSGTIAADTVAADTVAAPKHFGVLLTPPEKVTVPARHSDSVGMSVVLGSILILFAIVGLRFRNNRKYAASLLRNLVEVRLRNNVFDETVRETTFLVLLNLLWSFSAGIILYSLLRETVGVNGFANSFSLPSLVAHPSVCMALCMGVTTLYSGFMALAYMTVGSVFSDGVHARLWLKGYASSQGLLSFLWFPISMMTLFYPEWREILLWGALATFVLAKIVFIWKGFRIFFTQISSWLLFLYYLCSLELVPLILTYVAAMLLCGMVK